MAATGQAAKRATVEAASRTVVRSRGPRTALEERRGLGWEGELDAGRQGRLR